MSRVNDLFIHPSSYVNSKVIGKGTRIWAFVNISDNVTIGENCNICDHCFIEAGVVIGNNVTIKSGIYIWTGATIEDNVMLGPNVVFTNDVRHRSKQSFQIARINILHGASIGANSTILGGVTIGKYAMTGIGSVITKNVKDHALVYGNPAKQYGWVDEQGNKLKKAGDKLWESGVNIKYIETATGLTKL